MLASLEVRHDVGLAAGSSCLGGRVLSLQLIVNIDVNDSGAVVAAHDGKAAAVHRKGERRTGGVGLRHGAIPVVSTAAARVVDGPGALIGNAVVLAVDHGSGIRDAALDGLDLEVICIDLRPVGADLHTAREHRVCVGVAGDLVAVDVGIHGVAQAGELEVVLALGILGDGAAGNLRTDTVQLPVAYAVDFQRVAAVVPVHAGLGTDGQALIAARLCTRQGHVNGSAVIHPAPVADDGSGLTAVPLVHAGSILLLELAALNDPGTVGVQHVAGLIAAGNQIVLGGLLAGGGIVHRNVFLVGILKVIRVEVVVGGVLVFTGGVGIQHGTLLGLDVVAAAVLGGEALRRGVQRGRGHDAVGGHGDIGNAVLDLDILALLQVVVRDSGPDVQRVNGEVQVRGLDGEGLLILGVVDEHGGEVRLVRGSQRHVAGVAVDPCSLVLVVAGAEGAVGRVRQHTPDAVGVGVVLPAGLGEFRNVAQHVEHGVIVDIAAPRIAGGQQLLVTVLDALIEGANRGLEHVHCAAGTDKGVGQAVQQRQRALVAADGPGAVLGSLVLLQLGIAEGRAALAVPDLLVVHVRHLDVIIGGVGTVVEADSIDGVVHAGITAHQGNDLQALVLVRGDDFNVVVGLLRFLGEIAGEVGLVLQRVGEVLDDLAVGAAGLVLIGIDVVDDIAVLLVGVEDGFLIPFINGSVFLGAVGLGLDPVGILPAQDRDLDIRVYLLGVSSHDETRRTRGVGFLVLIALRTGLGAGGVVAVVAHLHLDVGEQRVIAAEQVLHHGPVGLRILGLVVQQQVAGGVTVQHAQALVGPAVDVLGRGLHVSAGDGDNTVHISGVVLGRQALCRDFLGLILTHGRALHDDVVVRAVHQVACAEGTADQSLQIRLVADLKADVGDFRRLFAVQVDNDFAAAFGFLIGQRHSVPLAALGTGQISLGRTDATVIGTVANLSLAGEYVQALSILTDGERRCFAVIAGGEADLQISQQRELCPLEVAGCVVDGRMAAVFVVPGGAGQGQDLAVAVQLIFLKRNIGLIAVGLRRIQSQQTVFLLQYLAEVLVVAIHGRVGNLHVAGALNGQPADGGGFFASRSSRPGHDLLGGDLKLAGLGGNSAVVLLRNGSIDRCTGIGGQAQIHGTVLATPPLTVSRCDLVLTGGQRELVGECLPLLVVLGVDAGVGLILNITAGVALRLGIGVHQAPGRVALVELVGLAVQQLVAQQRLGGGVGGSGLNIVHLVVSGSGHAVDKVNSVRRDDLHGVLVAGLILCRDGCIGLCEGIRGHIIRPVDPGRNHTDICCDASRGGLRCSSLLRSGGSDLLGGRSLLNRGIHRGESRVLRRCFLGRRLLSSRLLRWGLCGDCVLRRSLLGGRRSLLDDGSHWLFVGRKGLRRDHAGQHTDTKSRREYALALVLCFSHSLHPFSLSSVCIMHKSTLQWFTTIIQAASVFPPCENSRSSCTFSRTFPALRF